MKKILKQLQKGGGEFLTFMIVLPVLIFMFAVAIGIVQVGMVKERLEYTAYQACRAAVVCKNMEEAENAAYAKALENLEKARTKGGMKYDQGSLKVKLELVTSDDDNSKNDEDDMSDLWLKGNYVQCTVRVNVNPLTVFMQGERMSSIVMMIEYPSMDEGEGDYPWFRYM